MLLTLHTSIFYDFKYLILDLFEYDITPSGYDIKLNTQNTMAFFTTIFISFKINFLSFSSTKYFVINPSFL